jgi:hypothetical protein
MFAVTHSGTARTVSRGKMNLPRCRGPTGRTDREAGRPGARESRAVLTAKTAADNYRRRRKETAGREGAILDILKKCRDFDEDRRSKPRPVSLLPPLEGTEEPR